MRLSQPPPSPVTCHPNTGNYVMILTCPVRVARLSKAHVCEMLRCMPYRSCTPVRWCQTFEVRSRNPVSSSVISIYLWSELTYIDTKFPSARCHLADVLCSACGTTPLCHLSLTDGLWKRHAYERHAYEMAPVRGTPMRDTPVGWLL
jgi:hypothetical protein